MADTIVALSSGALPAAIAVIRMSGSQAFAAARTIAGSLPPPREARVRALRDGDTLLDQALVLTFAAPDTATGEDLVELHTHGSVAVVDGVIGALTRRPSVRPAEPGEFTRRALANGRIDLTQVEGLAALLAAQTRAQHRAAIHAAGGALHRAIARIENQVLDVSARIELLLDFADEDDAANEAVARRAIDDALAALSTELTDWIAAPTVDSLHRGFRIVLAGEPNSGKSTLLNRLSGRDAAIISDIAGTTRDRVDVPIEHGGVAFVLTDTAGLNTATADPIEKIGIDRARQAIEEADIVLWLGDDPSPRGDAVMLHPRKDVAARTEVPIGRIGISARTGDGIDRLWAELHSRVRGLMPPVAERALNQRQRECFRIVGTAIDAARRADDSVIVAHQLAVARGGLDRLTGRADVEAMLDRLFAGFCIGK